MLSISPEPYFQNLLGEHSVAGVPASLYNLTKSVPGPLYTTKATKWFGKASKVHGLEVNQNRLRSYFGSFWKILVYDKIFELTFILVMIHEVPSIQKFDHTLQISKNFRSDSIFIRKNFQTTWWLLWCIWLHLFVPNSPLNETEKYILAFNASVSLYRYMWTDIKGWTTRIGAKNEK